MKEAKRLELKELTNRVYEGKDPVSFEYRISDSDGKALGIFHWERIGNEREWSCILFIRANQNVETRVYSVLYSLPNKSHISSIPLTLVANVGMKLVQGFLKESIREEMAIDFIVGEVTSTAIEAIE